MRQPNKYLQYLLGLTLMVLLSACGGSSDSANDKPAPPATTTLTLQLTTPQSLPPDDTPQIKVLFDGNAETFKNKSLTVNNVDIDTTHTIAPQTIQISSSTGNTVTRCGAPAVTIASSTLAAGNATYTINYTCKTSTIVSGNFTTPNATSNTCNALNTTYNATFPTTTAEPKPYYLTAGLLVHIMANDYDRQLSSDNTTACVYPNLCGSIFWQKPPSEFITSTQASDNWPHDTWAFSYIHSSLKVTRPNIRPLYNSLPQTVMNKLTYGIILDKSTISQKKNIENCSYPKNGLSDDRITSDKKPCACGALEDHAKDAPTDCAKPNFFTQTPKQYGENYFNSKPQNFPPFENNAGGFNNMVKTSQLLVTLPSCNPPSKTITEPTPSTSCNPACDNTDPDSPCNAFNEIDINSNTWGSIQNDDPIKAVFALCNNDANSQNPCNLATQQRALDMLNQNYGPRSNYPIKQAEIPVVLLNINALIKQPTTQNTQSDSPTGPFICPAS